MATMADFHGGEEPAAAYTFKGHPQPPPDERLQECKNYLADEDINRNLDFESKLSQIEEYIKDLDEKQLPCDAKLLRDVRTMATVQREWLGIMDAPPCDKNSCKPDGHPLISYRLVSKEMKRALQDAKEALGLADQTREDHAPFTVEGHDQDAFLANLKKDQSGNPETVDEARNLSSVENRAYGWALKEPSLIPVWLHPRLGLSNKGIKAPDGDACFRGQALDFSAKAERRGVQRAAIELALNLFATNQEQHRPHDRFRRLSLPPKYQPPRDEVNLWKPLDPWERPVELDPFHYTRLMRKFRRWKDSDYTKARIRTIDEHPGQLQPPINYNGPFTLQSLRELREVARMRQDRLVQVSIALARTLQKSPRPLLERMCALINEAIKEDTGQPHLIQDNIPLTTSDLELFDELCEPSWSLEERQPYSHHPTGFPPEEPTLTLEKAKMEEFERDVMAARKADNDPQLLVPFWDPVSRHRADPSSDSYFTQAYNPAIPSQKSIELEALLRRINDERRARASSINARHELHMWKVTEIQHFLCAMHNAGRIHFDSAAQSISLVPLGGHPENKYVLSEQDAKTTTYIRFNGDTQKYEVQLDSSGNWGTPIVQPNKYQHFQQIAFRLGRDIRQLSELIATGQENDDAFRLQLQFEALQRTLQHMDQIDAERIAGTGNGKEISLKAIARDLLKYAPELLEDMGLDREHDISTITEYQAAQAIQMQLIEESNNNWEPRFPENEHVWDWVDDQVPSVQTPAGTTSTVARHPHIASGATTTQLQLPPVNKYFSLRRWPVECQSTAVQIKIKSSSLPTVEDKTE